MGKAAKGNTSADKSPDIKVFAEGKDEAGRRYFLLGANGKPIPNFPPVLVSRLIGSKKNEVLGELANAGFGLFTPTAQRVFIESVQKWGTKTSSFRVATKIGWHDGSYVLPDKIIGSSENIYASLAELDSGRNRKVPREKQPFGLADTRWQALRQQFAPHVCGVSGLYWANFAFRVRSTVRRLSNLR